MKKSFSFLFIVISVIFVSLSEAKQINFNPENKDEFIFVDSFFFNTNKGDALCKPKGNECDKKHNFKQYVNKKFIFPNELVVKKHVGSMSISYREIIIENGDKILFRLDDNGNLFSGFCRYYNFTSFQKWKNKVGQSLIENSNLIIDGVYIENYLIKIKLNNGVDSTEQYMNTLAKFLLHKSNRYSDFELSTLLFQVANLRYDKFEDAFFIDSYEKNKSPIGLGIVVIDNILKLKIYITNNNHKIYPNQFKILIDGNKYTSQKEQFTDLTIFDGNVVEQHVGIVSSEILDFLKNILTDSEVSVRISGDKYYSDFELTQKQRENIITFLRLYEEIKTLS